MARIKIGDIDIVSLPDVNGGYAQSFVFPETPASAWEPYRGLYPHTFKGDDLQLAVDTFAVVGAGRTILVDTGIGRVGPFAETAGLLDALRSEGLDAARIDTVIHTHLHGDHIGWNMVGGKQTFANARHVAQQLDYDHFSAADDAMFKAQIQPIFDAGRLELVSGETSYAPHITLIPTPGHTPGHQSIVVTSRGESAIITGDIAHHPAQCEETSWRDFFDMDAAAACASRAQLMQRLETDGTLAALCHFPAPGFGRVERRNGRRIFVPV